MHILLANDGDETRSEVTTVSTPTTHDNISDNIRPNRADCVTIENRTSLDYSQLDGMYLILVTFHNVLNTIVVAVWLPFASNQ